jgi:hypothetical protein
MAWPDVIDTTLLFGDPAMRLRLIPRARPPFISVARSGDPDAVDLAWNDLEPNALYEVWRDESPYFAPNGAARLVGTVDGATYTTGAAMVFTDDGSSPPPVTVIGDSTRNYFWLVRGVNTTGPSEESNRVGEFDFALTPGAP